jgi:hypothetical protein
MLKNIIIYIFMYILLIGCENPMEPTCGDCILDMSAPSLEQDSNGYYHLDFLNNYTQTFTTLEADVGNDYEYVGWTSNTQYCFEHMGTNNCSNVVNGASYSGMDGIAKTVLGVHGVHIGDTVRVYCGYYDDYGNQWLDSFELIIDE